MRTFQVSDETAQRAVHALKQRGAHSSHDRRAAAELEEAYGRDFGELRAYVVTTVLEVPALTGDAARNNIIAKLQGAGLDPTVTKVVPA